MPLAVRAPMHVRELLFRSKALGFSIGLAMLLGACSVGLNGGNGNNNNGGNGPGGGPGGGANGNHPGGGPGTPNNPGEVTIARFDATPNPALTGGTTTLTWQTTNATQVAITSGGSTVYLVPQGMLDTGTY